MTEKINIEWSLKHFDELITSELYHILDLRNRIFVMEQNCVYADTDGKDLQSHHLAGYLNNTLICYARLLPPGLSYPEPSIGRVVCESAYRRKGVGRMLMQKAVITVFELWNAKYIKISAQSYLIDFYESIGFQALGDPYLEDGISHREMIFEKKSDFTQ